MDVESGLRVVSEFVIYFHCSVSVNAYNPFNIYVLNSDRVPVMS